MKTTILALVLLVSSVCFAKEEQVFFFQPSLHLGVGVEMQTGLNPNDYGMILLKSYAVEMGGAGIGAKLLGLGVSLNAHNEAGLVVSPVCFHVGRICVGPEFIMKDSTKTNFGSSISYEF